MKALEINRYRPQSANDDTSSDVDEATVQTFLLRHYLLYQMLERSTEQS